MFAIFRRRGGNYLGSKTSNKIRTRSTLPSISHDSSHHIDAFSKPSYEKRFKRVLAFHTPENVAPVLDINNNAYHIDLEGEAIYPFKFKRTFGFYAGRAGVIGDFDNFFHITINGERAYSDNYKWCGNFSILPVHNKKAASAMSPVQKWDNSYYYIDENGEILRGPYQYAGDPNSQGQSVVWNSAGECHITEHDGSDWCTEKSVTRKWIDACVPHKGIAAVKDEQGWYYVDSAGVQVGCDRYMEVEPHYNGRARVRRLSGERVIIDEDGELAVNLMSSDAEAVQELLETSQRYWASLGLKKILENDVIGAMASSSIDRNVNTEIGSETRDVRMHILCDVAMQLGLCRSVSSTHPHEPSSLQLTRKGEILNARAGSQAVTRDRCLYWLQHRYLTRWMTDERDLSSHTPRTPDVSSSVHNSFYENPILPDTFHEISTDKEAVALSQRVLASYAQDWEGIATVLPLERAVSPSYQEDADTLVVADLGGGTGVLLREVSRGLSVRGINMTNVHLICVDRPEVAELARTLPCDINERVDFIEADILSGAIPSARWYLMSRVLHDWDEDRALMILRNVHQRSPKEAILTVIDRCTSNNNRHALLSLHMFLLQRSYERNASQWNELFTRGGWSIVEQMEYNDHAIMTLMKTSTIEEERKT